MCSWDLSHGTEINQKSDSLSTHCAHVASRISSSPPTRARHPGKFPRQFWPPAFSYTKRQLSYKTSAFVTGKCRLKVKSAGETCQDGRIRTCALKKGDKLVFTIVGLLDLRRGVVKTSINTVRRVVEYFVQKLRSNSELRSNPLRSISYPDFMHMGTPLHG